MKSESTTKKPNSASERGCEKRVENPTRRTGSTFKISAGQSAKRREDSSTGETEKRSQDESTTRSVYGHPREKSWSVTEDLAGRGKDTPGPGRLQREIGHTDCGEGVRTKTKPDSAQTTREFSGDERKQAKRTGGRHISSDRHKPRQVPENKSSAGNQPSSEDRGGQDSAEKNTEESTQVAPEATMSRRPQVMRITDSATTSCKPRVGEKHVSTSPALRTEYDNHPSPLPGLITNFVDQSVKLITKTHTHGAAHDI